MKHIILDTDPGVDDALAFILAFNSPELKVEAITTVAGNVNHTKGHRNAKQLIEFLGVDVPVCAGAVKPLIKHLGHAEDVHGNTGLGEAQLPEPTLETDSRSAVEMILEKANELGKKLTLVAVGPLTNIASAILADSDLPSKIDKLVIMGGAFFLTPSGHGNVNAVAEFNIWVDPEAANIVFSSGIPIVAAGLDTTSLPENRMSVEMFNRITSKGNRTTDLVDDLCRKMVQRSNGFSLHDPQAIAYVVKPELFTTEPYYAVVECDSNLTRGMTVVERRRRRKDPPPANVDVIVKVDSEEFHTLVEARISGE